jgi:prephenate dehydrogenase
MKALVVGLGQFGLFVANHLIASGIEVFAWDVSQDKKAQLESIGGNWADLSAKVDIVILAIFPAQVTHDLVERFSRQALLVNISSVQQTGLQALLNLGVEQNRIFSFHPLFGPVRIASSGWDGKLAIVTHDPRDYRAEALVRTFRHKRVVFIEMSPEEHDQAMSTQGLAFLIADLVQVGIQGADPRYLSGSAQHMLGLLDLTAGSRELRQLILSNSALKQIYPKLKNTLEEIAEEFGWK